MIRTNIRGSGDRRYTRYLAHYAKRNYALLGLGFLFVAGVFLGAFLIRLAENETLALLLRVVNNFVEKRQEHSLIQNFISTAASSLLFVAILFICGFCAVSQPVSVFAPMFRGLGFGFSAASLYANYGARAAGFISLFLIPDMLFSTLAILLCCRESLRLSGNFWGLFRGGDNTREAYPLRIYLGRYVAAAVLCVISAFFESILYFIFAKYFVLG